MLTGRPHANVGASTTRRATPCAPGNPMGSAQRAGAGALMVAGDPHGANGQAAASATRTETRPILAILAGPRHPATSENVRLRGFRTRGYQAPLLRPGPWAIDLLTGQEQIVVASGPATKRDGRHW